MTSLRCRTMAEGEEWEEEEWEEEEEVGEGGGRTLRGSCIGIGMVRRRGHAPMGMVVAAAAEEGIPATRTTSMTRAITEGGLTWGREATVRRGPPVRFRETSVG